MRAQQFARVSVSLWAVTVWLALLGLITTPYLIRHLGAAQYGIFALITIMSAYLSHLELGFGQATLRFVARARAAGDVDEERYVLATSLAVFVGAGVAATTIALVASSFIADTFVHGSAEGDVALDAIRLGALMLLTALLANFAGVSLQGLSEFGLVIKIRAVFGTLTSAGSVITVAVGGGLREVLVVLLAINIGLCATLLGGLARSTNATLRPRVHRPTLVPMARFGVSVLVAGLAFQVVLQGPPTVLAGYSTTDQVASYAVPSMIMQQILVLTGVASLAFAPFASAESVSADRTRLAEIFRANMRMTLLIVGPVAAYLGLLGEPLLATWISPSFAADAIGPLRFLTVAAVMLALSGPAADVVRGLGKPAWVAAYTISVAIITLIAAFALVTVHGAAGVAAALLGGLVVGTSPLLVLTAQRLLDISPAELAHALGRPLAAIAFSVAMFALGAEWTSGFAGAVLAGFVGTLAYGVIVARWILEARERRALRTLRPKWMRQAAERVA
jgi:O-antigen/teichoic acid export membrane protein